MKRWIAFFLAAALGVCGGVVLAMFFQVSQVTDGSMMPGFEQGQRVLVRSSFDLAGVFGGAGSDDGANGPGPGSFDVERGDVVLFDNQIYAATGEGRQMMKRVVALGGDRVLITGGRVYVNNAALEEPYVFTEDSSGEMEEIRIPDGYVFVLGDNRAASTDSRSEAVGLVRQDDLRGKVIYRW